MNPKRLTPIQSIRQKCINCCCHQLLEVRLCSAASCPLWPYRMGKRPQKKPFSEYQIKKGEAKILPQKTLDLTKENITERSITGHSSLVMPIYEKEAENGNKTD